MPRKSRVNLPPATPMTDFTPDQLTPKVLTKQEFGRRLGRLLIEKQWNQSDLARAANIGRDSISTYVNGKAFPTPVVLSKLAKALGVTQEQLLPNQIISAMEDEAPEVDFRQAPGHPEKAYLRINRLVPTHVAVEIIRLIYEADKDLA